MHTKEQLQNAYRAIDALMAVATEGMDTNAQQVFEIDAIALYLGTQIATFKSDADRDMALTSIISSIREVIAERDRLSAVA